MSDIRGQTEQAFKDFEVSLAQRDLPPLRKKDIENIVFTMPCGDCEALVTVRPGGQVQRCRECGMEAYKLDLPD